MNSKETQLRDAWGRLREIQKQIDLISNELDMSYPQPDEIRHAHDAAIDAHGNLIVATKNMKNRIAELLGAVTMSGKK